MLVVFDSHKRGWVDNCFPDLDEFWLCDESGGSSDIGGLPAGFKPRGNLGEYMMAFKHRKKTLDLVFLFPKKVLPKQVDLIYSV